MKTKLEEKYPELEASERTVRRDLNRLGFTSVIPRRAPILTQQTKDDRLYWAHEHLNYNWNKVVFSDETTIKMFCKTMHGHAKKNGSAYGETSF